ncbi:MAG: SH3 domain-containing protein [Lachnospiraceae bacterium]
MKNFLKYMIIVMLTLSLAGCTPGKISLSDTAGNTECASEKMVLSENTDRSDEESGTKTQTSAEDKDESSAQTDTSETDAKEQTAQTEASISETSEAESTETMPQVNFEDADDYVYSTAAVYVRTGPGKSYPSAGCLEKGERVSRTGIGSNGWYRILYGTGIGYVSGNFMTTQYPDVEAEDQKSSEDDAVYTAVDETVYPTIILNVRTGPGTGYRKAGGFEKGEAVHRVAIGSNGWSKVEFRGAVYYASSEYLSASKPETGETASSAVSKSGELKLSDSTQKNFRVTARWSGSNIRLDWTKCDGVERYIIFRKADWQKYEVDRLASGPGQAFTDTTAVSDAEYFSENGISGIKTKYYEYYICTERENGEIDQLGSCRISMDR